MTSERCCFSESFSYVLAAGVMSWRRRASLVCPWCVQLSDSSPAAGPGDCIHLHHVPQRERHWCETHRKCDLTVPLSLWLRRLFLKENKSSCRLLSRELRALLFSETAKRTRAAEDKSSLQKPVQGNVCSYLLGGGRGGFPFVKRLLHLLIRRHYFQLKTC